MFNDSDFLCRMGSLAIPIFFEGLRDDTGKIEV